MPKATLSQAELLQKQREYLSEVVIDVETMAIFDSLPGFLCFLKNRAGEHLYASGLWTTRHGFREAWEMLFKTDQDLTPGAMAESYLADDAIVYRTGQPVLDKIEICLDAVGLPDWHVTNKYPVRNRKGEIIGILGISRVCMGQAPVASLNVKIRMSARNHSMLRPSRISPVPGSGFCHTRRRFSIRYCRMASVCR